MGAGARAPHAVTHLTDCVFACVQKSEEDEADRWADNHDLEEKEESQEENACTGAGTMPTEQPRTSARKSAVQGARECTDS